jgi:hypothetical protein
MDDKILHMPVFLLSFLSCLLLLLLLLELVLRGTCCCLQPLLRVEPADSRDLLLLWLSVVVEGAWLDTTAISRLVGFDSPVGGSHKGRPYLIF